MELIQKGAGLKRIHKERGRAKMELIQKLYGKGWRRKGNERDRGVAKI